MKFTQVLATLTLVILIALTGCSKSGSTTTTVAPGTPYLTASTTGPFALNFSATDTFLKSIDNTSSTHPTLTIIGHDNNGDVLDLVIYNYPIAVGTFPVDSVHTSAYYTHFPTGGGVAKSGTVVITSVTPNVAGTFTFTCTDLTIVTGAYQVVAP